MIVRMLGRRSNRRATDLWWPLLRIRGGGSSENSGMGRDRTLGETSYFAGMHDYCRGARVSLVPPVSLPEDQSGDHDGRTVYSTKMGELQVRAREFAEKPETVGTSAPKVLALLCVNGHPSPTHAQNCRVLGHDE